MANSGIVKSDNSAVEKASFFMGTSRHSGPCNSFNCLGHFIHVYDDDDDDDDLLQIICLIICGNHHTENKLDLFIRHSATVHQYHMQTHNRTDKPNHFRI